MTKEKDDFLGALGRRDLDLDLSPDEVAKLRHSMKMLSSTARLAHALADRPDETAMYGTLAAELSVAADSPAFGVFQRTQLAKIMDDNGQLVLRELASSDVPVEDAQFLADCGIKHPTDEITISIVRLKAGYWPTDGEGHSRVPIAQLVEYSRVQLTKAAESLADREDAVLPTAIPKPKKYFNGIGKILSGVVAGTGNVLIGVGAIPATGGVAAAGVIASAAVSIGVIMQGIGDLRGE